MTELPLYYPVTTEIDKDHDAYKRQITDFYDASAEAVAAHLLAGRTVAVLSEGDPLFYGSYMHLHVRLAGRFPAEVIPGITAMSGCWSLAGLPLVQGDDVLSVLPGTMGEGELQRRLADTAGRGHHEGRPKPAEDPPGAGGGRQARGGRLCRARHHEECSDGSARRRSRTTRRPISRWCSFPAGRTGPAGRTSPDRRAGHDRKALHRRHRPRQSGSR